MPAEAAPGAYTKIALNTVVTDTHGFWDTTNKRYVPQIPGRYMAQAFFAGTQVGGSGTFWDLLVVQNGATFTLVWHNRLPSSTAYGPNIITTGVFLLNGSTDFLELWGGQGNNVAITGSERLEVVYLGRD